MVLAMAAFALVISVFVPATAMEAPPEVMTSHGPVVGILTGKDAGVSAFFGIPYARPPVGPLRFRPPAPAVPWTEPLDLSTAPQGAEHQCLQPAAGGMQGSEDCLKLTAYSPGLPSGGGSEALRPVMLWIHGGSFTAGDYWQGGLYNGTELAQRYGVVVFAAQYRLGVLATLAMDKLQEENPDHSTGNYGMMDQRAAMLWVRDNAARFGGDPSRVTIFGESAGGESMCYHLVSPASAGLFAAVIMESGSCDLQFDTVPVKQETLRLVSDQTNCTWGSSEYLDCLRGVDGAVIQGLITPKILGSHGYKVGPAIDGTAVGLPDMPINLLDAGRFNKVPVIFGVNKFEYQYSCRNRSDAELEHCAFLGFNGSALVTDQEFRARLEDSLEVKLSDGQWAQVLAEYPLEDYGGNRGARFSTMATDAGFIVRGDRRGHSMHIGECGTARAAESVARAGSPVWMYRMDKLGETLPFVQHGSEIPFVFDRLQLAGYHLPADKAATTLIGNYWTNLAKFRDPNGASSGASPVPRWPAFNLSAPQVAAFWGATVRPEPLVRTRFCAFWQRLLTTAAGSAKSAAAAAIIV